MSDEQVVPAVAINHDRCFGVDRNVDRLRLRMQALPGFRIEFDKTEKIFTKPSDKRTEDYVTGRFG